MILLPRDAARLGIGDWAALPFFAEPDGWSRVARKLEENAGWHPRAELLFRALQLTQPNSVKAVILGMDPYPDPGFAFGLAFSLPPGITIPKGESLARVLGRLPKDQSPPDGDLVHWAQQGVLMLNVALSYLPKARLPAMDKAPRRKNPHLLKKFGWWDLAQQIIRQLAARPLPPALPQAGPPAAQPNDTPFRPAFCFWGEAAIGAAYRAAPQLFAPGSGAVFAGHPSNLAPAEGFTLQRKPRKAGAFKQDTVGFSRHAPFEHIDQWVARMGLPPIHWGTPPPAAPQAGNKIPSKEAAKDGAP